MSGLVPAAATRNKRRMIAPARPILAMPGRMAKAAIAFALPPRCPGCGMVTPNDHEFCVACWMKLDFASGPACATCAIPLDFDSGEDARCEPCLAHPPTIDGMRAAVVYGDIPRGMVMRLKYGRRPGIAQTIARRLDRLVDRREALIVPVPLHRWRIWSRGYNQSALIGRALARRLDMTLAPDLIRRVRATPVLRGLTRQERARAVRDVFAIPAPASVVGRSILLVDDVFTTGATANACALALKEAGAAEVRLICWARVALEGADDDIAPWDSQPAVSDTARR